MSLDKLKHSDLTGKVIGCAYEVHRILGVGFQEVIYQKALEIELEKAGIEFEREYNIPIYYKKIKVGERRVDFLIKGTLMIEIKAVSQLEDVHLAQTLNYLQASNIEIGLLLNFGAKSMEIKRVINSRK